MKFKINNKIIIVQGFDVRIFFFTLKQQQNPFG